MYLLKNDEAGIFVFLPIQIKKGRLLVLYGAFLIEGRKYSTTLSHKHTHSHTQEPEKVPD